MVAIVGAGWGCASSDPPVVPRPEPGQVSELVDRWLTCVECSQGELADVVRAGFVAVPLLEAALQGPTPELRAALEVELSASWRRTAVYLLRTGDRPGLSEGEYIASHLENLTVLMRRRAGAALDQLRIPRPEQPQ